MYTSLLELKVPTTETRQITEKEYNNWKEKLERLNSLNSLFSYNDGYSFSDSRKCIKLIGEVTSFLNKVTIIPDRVKIGSVVTLMENNKKTFKVRLVVNSIPNVNNCCLLDSEMGQAIFDCIVGDSVDCENKQYKIIKID